MITQALKQQHKKLTVTLMSRFTLGEFLGFVDHFLVLDKFLLIFNSHFTYMTFYVCHNSPLIYIQVKIHL